VVVQLHRVVGVPHDVVIDDVVARAVVQEDPRPAETAGLDVVDLVVGDLGAAAVHPEGVDGAAVGGLEHRVVDQVVGNLQRVGVGQLHRGAAGVVDRVPRDDVPAPDRAHPRGVAGI